MDFKGTFGPMPALMATAEYVTKVHASTGNLANYSFRKPIMTSRMLVKPKNTNL
jgi:hypothetical protein